jgi:hypothetical protein
MSLDLKRARNYLQSFDFCALFIEELGWSYPSTQKVTRFQVGGQFFSRVAIAELAGVVILEITADSGPIPEAKTRDAIHEEISSFHGENLLIFLDSDRSRSLWYWVKRDGTKSYRRDHLFVRGQSGDLFLSKLGGLVVDITEFERNAVNVVSVARKLKNAFDIEKVTKNFYQEFQRLHVDFLGFIAGISLESDRRWYASVILNRLMFVYFLQRKYFLDNGDDNYLQHKLAICRQQGDNQFYPFLKELFFEGFAKPEYSRDLDARKRLGKIRYLNGGLFLKHPIEEKYPTIAIEDTAFASVFTLFSKYSWNLDDTPGGNDEEINPDVLGYIFEKYINQKEFGAYYTRPEITEYLCDRTINKLIRDRLGEEEKSLNDLLLNLNGDRCALLLNTILPDLTLLDPACGSGAFLVAAMKTLISLYSTVVEQAKKFLDHPQIARWLADANSHPSLDYYIKKRIITDNLYGVDIMEEATEIAKLRLFLALVASAKTVEELEPLPNIDFNIMAGNSLIGLIRVDAEGFDKVHATLQGNILQQATFNRYQEILADKNRSIELYKKHAFNQGEQAINPKEESLLLLRRHIENLNGQSQAKLNQLLLDEFSGKLKIKYEEAQPTGKPKKRLLTLEDITDLEPFHWGYHFDTVFARGGFDAIITNPPWEIFKPNAKEFFAEYSDLVQKKKMTIKAFEKEQKELLKDPEISQAWCEYQSKFPHVSSYFRSAEQYINQISIVNGKKAGTDINLYKLFLEQCFNLLRSGGRGGIIVPSGIYTDLGTKQLREVLFSRTKIDSLFGLSNEKFIFENVHHAFKFALFSFEKDNQTDFFQASFRINPREAIKPEELDTFLHDRNQRVEIPVSLVHQLSPDSLSVMEFKNELDIRIAEKMSQFPLLGEKIDGTWNLKLTAEFHMTNDSHLFKTEPAKGRLPLYEGKMIHQFTHQFAPEQLRYWVDEKEGRRAILGKIEDIGQKMNYQDYRLGFRKIASTTNNRTIISTIIPPSFCSENFQVALSFHENLERYIKYDGMIFLCGLWNSFVLDFLLRQRISANINFFYVYQLPVPRLQQGDRYFAEIVDRAGKLICTTPEFDELAQEVGLESHREGITDESQRGQLRAELDGMIAHLYGLSEEEFAYILTTFPIVPEATKQDALEAYRHLQR